MEEVLAEIGNALTKEKTRRENANKSQNTGVFQLTANMMVQPGESDFASPMSKDLSTLKSLIQMIVQIFSGPQLNFFIIPTT